MLPAKVVIALPPPPLVKVYIPPAPSNAKPLANILPVWVTVPPTLSNSTLKPVALIPATAKPVSSLNVRSPPNAKLSASNVVTALFASFKSNVPFSNINVGVVIA